MKHSKKTLDEMRPHISAERNNQLLIFDVATFNLGNHVKSEIFKNERLSFKVLKSASHE